MYYPKDYINKVIQGDCLEVMKGMPDKCVDLVLTDPPYGTTQCAWDVVVPFNEMWSELNRILKDDCMLILTASQPFTSNLIVSNIKNYKYSWTWNKKQSGSFMMAKFQPLRITEDICVFSKGKPKYFPQMRKGEMRKKGGAKKSMMYGATPSKMSDQYYPTNILDISNAFKGKRQHETQKPIALMSYLLKTYSSEGETVLDPFAGSGSTLIACKELGRKYIGIELSQKYCDIANERLAQDLLFV